MTLFCPVGTSCISYKDGLPWSEDFTLENMAQVNVSVPHWCYENNEQLQMKGRLQPQAAKLVRHLETCSLGDDWEIYQQLIAKPTTGPTMLFQRNWLL